MSSCEGFASAFWPVVQYWDRIQHELNQPLSHTPLELVEGFWPQHDWRVRDRSMNPQPVGAMQPPDYISEDEDRELYCGPRNEAPLPRFNPFRDIRMGTWILARPSDPNVYPVWQGRALSPTCLEVGHENYKKFLCQWWEPRNSHTSYLEKYANCWDATWVKENSAPTWETASSVVFGIYSSIVDPRTRTIPEGAKVAALENLRQANDRDP
jgi:hypothetical protein